MLLFIQNFLEMFGGGVGNFDSEMVRLTIGIVLWSVLILFVIHIRNHSISKNNNEDYILFSTICGILFNFILLIFTVYIESNKLTKLFPLTIVYEKDLTIIPPILHFLNLNVITYISLYFLLYFNLTKPKEVKKCRNSSFILSIFFLIFSYTFCYWFHYYNFSFLNFLYHITCISILFYVLYYTYKLKFHYMKNNTIMIILIMIIVESISSIDIYFDLKYTLLLSPLRNILQNLYVSFLIYFFIKAQAKDLEEQRNEFITRSTDRQIIIQGVAHELRSPLSGLVGMLDVFKEKILELTSIDIDRCIGCSLYNTCIKKEKCSNCEKTNLLKNVILGFEEIENIVKRLNDMVLDLTEFGKNSRQYDIKDYDLKPLIETSIRFAKFTETSKLVTNTEHGIYFQTTEQCKAYALVSPSKFLQIMQNLILNSIKAIQVKNKLDAKIKISLKTNKETNFHIIEVEDNGIGMTKEEVEQCTEKYYTTNINSGGTGLGLYFVEKYVNEFNGKLEIQSTYNKGTKIIIYLPISEGNINFITCNE